MGIIALTLQAWLWGSCAFLLPFWITLPFGRDQGIFAQVATVIQDGGLPYRDAWELKGPLIHFLFAGCFAVFGRHEWAFNAVFLALLGATLALACRCQRTWVKSGSGVLAALFLLNRAQLVFWNFGQPDTIIACLAVCIACLSADDAGGLAPRRAFLSGTLCAAAAWIKPPFGLLVLTPLLAIVLRHGRDGTTLRRHLACLLLGFLALSLVVLTPFVFNGALPALWEVLVEFNLSSHADKARQASWPIPLPIWAGDKWGRIDFYFALLKLAGACWMAVSSPVRALVLGCAWAACYLAVAAQGKFWNQHLFPLEFIGVLFAAYGMARLLALISTARPGWRSAALAALFLLGLRPLLYVHCRLVNSGIAWWSHRAGAMEEQEWMDRFVAEGFALTPVRDAADAVRRLSSPTDSIYLWGFDSLLYFLADRTCPTRLAFNYPMLVGAPAYIQKCRTELMMELRNHPPRLIVVQDGDSNPLYRYDSADKLPEFPELAALISVHYSLAHQNERFAVYRRTLP